MMRFEELDNDFGSQLHALPEVNPEPNFAGELKERLKTQHEQKLKAPLEMRKNRWIRGGMIAATVLFILSLSFSFIDLRPENDSSQASLPYAYAQAEEGIGMRFTLRDGLNSLRQIDFQLQGPLPAGKSTASIIKYNRSLDTPDKVIKLGRSVGINITEVKNEAADINGTRTVFEGKDARLTVSCYQGAWYYESLQSPALESENNESAEGLKSIALQWLQQRELIPLQAYTITQKQTVQDELELTFSPQQGPDGMTIVGFAPRISVTVDNRGQITRANGIWFTEKERIPASLMDFSTALKSLQNGEGVFTASNIKSAVPGQAVVKDVKMAYQLSYGLDYTPYLIPVAVFSGSFTPQGGKEESFTAYVSLLKYQERENAGNFKLYTELPKAVDRIAIIKEKSQEQLLIDLSAVARSLGLGEKPDADGVYNGTGGQLTSLDNNWIYRSARPRQSKPGLNLSDIRILQLANQTAKIIPLPGKLGKPLLKEVNSVGFRLVIYPLLYDNTPVDSIYSPFGSSLGIEIDLDGEIESVRCVHPMQTSENKAELLSPQQAWEKLLANQAQIQVEGFFGMLPGDHFVVDQSRVTEVRLVYLPDHPELSPNENYDIKYLFRGTAHTDGGLIKFKAYVDAVK